MSKFVDLTGLKFNYLTVIKRDGSYDLPNGKHIPKWLCKCDCGNFIHTRSYCLTSNHTKSCGCFQKEQARKLKTTYGLGNTRLSYIWRDMKKRCYNEKSKYYKNYGGRGIKVCDEWLNDFMNFYNWAIDNGYNDNLTLDRVNVNGNYEPINCKWSTKMEQANNRRNNVIVFYNERYLTLKELSELLNVNYRTINKQKLRGWTIEKILKKAGVNDENLLLYSRFL